MTDEELENIIGRVAWNEYSVAPDYAQKEVREFAEKIRGFSDEEFTDQAASMIRESALMQGFRGNWEGVHSMASACYHEAFRRHIAAGHSSECRGSTLYSEAFNRAVKSQGCAVQPLHPCDCKES